MIKKLHLFVLKSFLPLFAMTFFIVLFIVLMQFIWRYIDDLVGKGLSMGIIGELFFYAAVSMVPMALPLAILLASLMTFGNLGEKFELTAMKSAGISLLRVMAPLIVVIAGIAVGAFFFQNNVLPKAQVKMWTLLFSMRQKSPEVEIPVGVFYDQIPGINVYVGEKNRETGMLRDVKIYDVRRGGENVTILVSDSARMALTEDMKYIYLNMFHGSQYEKMATTSSMKNDPFRRENFETKEILIPFDNNFKRLDEGGVKKQYVGKNLDELRFTIDSLNLRLDSLGAANSRIVASQLLMGRDPRFEEGAVQTPSQEKKAPEPYYMDHGKPVQTLSWDSLLSTLSPSVQNSVVAAALRNIEQRKGSLTFEAQTVANEKKLIRRHAIEMLKKFTLSVACVIFFFIGAPLGAIIRKGGIGMPLVISVILFLIYYIIDNTGYKMARDGHAAVWFGMWLSTFILAPLGVWVTYKAMHDSAVFDPDRIRMFFRRITFRKEVRGLALKEVVIEEVNGDVALEKIMGVEGAADDISKALKKKWFMAGKRVKRMVVQFNGMLDDMLEYLHNSHDPKVIKLLNDYPVIRPTRFMRKRKLRRYLRTVEALDARLLGLAPDSGS